MRKSCVAFVVLGTCLAAQPASKKVVVGCVPDLMLCHQDSRGTILGYWAELFHEAARREGVTIEWKFFRRPLDQVFDEGEVDFHPGMSVTPERKAKYHLTRPWWVEDHFLMVPATSPHYRAEDLKGQLVLYANRPPLTRHPQEFLPGARLEEDEQVQAIHRVCRGEAAAVLFGVNRAHTGFLRGETAPLCGFTHWRILPFGGLLREVAIASPRSKKAIAERFRDRLDQMLDDGTFGRITSQHMMTHQYTDFLLRMDKAYGNARMLQMVVASLAVLLLLSLLYVLSLSKSTRKTAAALEQLRRLTGQLLRQEDDERRRLARELHDGVGQQLVAIRMDADRLQKTCQAGDEESKEVLGELRQLALDAGRDLRSLSFLLHPPVLEELGLLASLRALAEGFSARSQVNVEMVLEEGAEPRDAALQLAIFRIVQESLVNVQKHSSSKTAKVSLHHEKGKLRLQVLDQGQPLGPQAEGVGVGIASMRERASLLGGHLDVRHTAEGTTVEAWFPVSG